MSSERSYVGKKKSDCFDIALVLCPCFTIGTPPLGLAYLQSILKQSMYSVLPYDIDFLLLRSNSKLFYEFYAIYNIGNMEDTDRVQYILRPYLTLIALFPEHFSSSTKGRYNAELAIINKLEKYLGNYAKSILSFRIRIAMFSVFISNLLASLLLAKQLKRLEPSIKIVFGGPGVGLLETQEFILKLGWVDICITGEGEKNVSLIADAIFSGRSVSQVPGISLLENLRMLSWPEVPLLDLDNLPIPDFTNFPCVEHNILHYRSNPSLNIRWNAVALPIASTRGCIMKCAFCSESQYWKKFRQRKVENVVQEIEEQKDRWGIRQFQFCDSLLNGTQGWIEEFSEKIIERGTDVEFTWAYFRPTKLSKYTLERMALAGFRLIYYGMETGSQEVLNLMKKGTKIEEIKQIIKDTLRCGIHVDITMLCGFPGESRDNFYRSLFLKHQLISEISCELGKEYIKRLSIDAGSIIRVEPYSDLFNNAQKYGITLKTNPTKLPTALHYFADCLERLSVKWESGLTVEEKVFRSSVLRSYVYKEPSIVYQKNSEIFCINDKTVFSRLNEDVDVLYSLYSSPTCYFVKKGTVFAEVNDLTLRVWQLIDGNITVGEIVKRISQEIEIKDIENKIKKVLEQFLISRLIYFQDF